MKIAIILGTRPEIIKLSPIIRICESEGLDYFIIHTNQHYSENMDKVFFDDLELPQPKYNLEVGSGTKDEQVDKGKAEIEKVLVVEKPDVVVVQGDTNTVLAGALAADKLDIKIAHVESGLRSYDLSMPEEKNRIETDKLSEFCFAPTDNQKKILIDEGMDQEKIYVVGNTIVDAVKQNLEIADKKVDVLNRLGLVEKGYVVVTAHRQSNVDEKSALDNLFKVLADVSQELDINLIYPIHPRTKKMLDEFKIEVDDNIKLIEPIGFLEFLQLEKNAKLILTDSGGIQEEGCILGVPCVTLRENTERPETVDVGANIVAGLKSKDVVEAAKKMVETGCDWENPLGDGNSGKKIIDILKERLS